MLQHFLFGVPNSRSSIFICCLYFILWFRFICLKFVIDVFKNLHKISTRDE